MSETLETAARRLTEAKQGGDADDIAEALALHANALLQGAQFLSAANELDEAATIHRARGRRYDEARCTQLGATVWRFAGKLGEARKRANRALELSECKGAIAVSAFAELGEIELAENKNVEAANAYRAALDAGQGAGLLASARAALLRKRAAALTAAGQHQEAVRDLEMACALLMRSGDRATAVRVLIEEATALRYADRPADAEPIVRQAMDLAGEAGDRAALADLHLLVGARALDQGDAAVAMASVRTAREQALAGNAPTSYLGASITIAQLAELAGDRLAAYEALATGWATVGDLLGKDAARVTFEPKLREARERWGPVAFDEIKRTYQENRRRQMARSS